MWVAAEISAAEGVAAGVCIALFVVGAFLVIDQTYVLWGCGLWLLAIAIGVILSAIAGAAAG